MQSALFCLGHKSVTGHNAKVNGPEPIWCYFMSNARLATRVTSIKLEIVTVFYNFHSFNIPILELTFREMLSVLLLIMIYTDGPSY